MPPPKKLWLLLGVEAVLFVAGYAPPYAGVVRRLIGTLAGVGFLALGLLLRQSSLRFGTSREDAKDEGSHAATAVVIGAVCSVAWAFDIPRRV